MDTDTMVESETEGASENEEEDNSDELEAIATMKRVDRGRPAQTR
jgi:hypothetical protein